MIICKKEYSSLLDENINIIKQIYNILNSIIRIVSTQYNYSKDFIDQLN